MNFAIAEFSEGRAVFVVEPAEYHYNPIGVVHGGVAATLLDSAMGCAVHSTLPVGAGYATLEIKVKYLRPMTAKTGSVRCEAKVIHVGQRTATAEGRIVDDDGLMEQLLASFFVRKRRRAEIRDQRSETRSQKLGISDCVTPPLGHSPFSLWEKDPG